ncbi:LOW QUALITY PROTEIN: uncharacterized protein LOC121429428 [Lytechinus variegatus]|uniref:LOW QUALITY PROTEIN: uncharacterized protein LOC121429428 n=1 Tax=Lytechinus variegatus TaxID=7654 RepID=UPI001BB11BEF|nr:LOW QUALITY PROTEIN: uncharacterized protein LOC121429428 [Lytechinus variegatus]
MCDQFSMYYNTFKACGFKLCGCHTLESIEATSGLGSEEPQLDPEEDDHLRSLDTKHPHLLTGEFLVKRNSRSKPPFQGRVSPPTSYFNPWVLQPQQLRKKLESLQQQEEGGGNDWRNGVPKQMKPELIVVDIFDDSQEVSCGDKDCKMPQESIMEDPISESVANMDALEDVSRDLEGDATLEQSGNSPPRFVRSVSSIPSRNRQVSVDSVSGANQRTEKHARTTNNNRRSLSPQAREYASRLNASGKQRSQSQASSGENDDQQTNGYRQRKKSLALAMNEGRLEMKEVCMRPLDVDLDFHLIAQLNQLNRELMDLSKSGSSTSPSSPGVGANHSFSLLENNSEILADGDTKHSVSSSPQSPNSLQVQQTKHSPGNDMYSPISSRRGRSPVEAKQKKFSYDSPRRKQSDENVTPVFSSKKSSPEQRTISENSKESKSVSPREVISRIKSRFSNPKLTRGSPQRSSAGKIEIQILRPNLGNSENESGPFKRSASLRNDSDSRKTWPSLEASTEGYEENSQSPSGQSHVYRRSESDGPLERQRKKPVLPDSNPMIEQNHNAPGSSTDSGLGKDQRHSKSSADSLLEDFHVSSQVSSRCNSNPPSRPLSSDTGDLSWEKGRDLLSPRLRGFPGYLSSSTPHSPTNLTPATGSREDLLDDGFSRPESQEDLLGSRGNGMRASGSSQGSSISHAMQSGIKPPKPRHKPLRRSKTDLGDPSIIKAALTLAKMQGDETPKAVEGSSRMPSATKKRPTSALGIMGILNSGSGRESPVTQVTQPDGKPSPRLQRSQHQPAPEPLSLVVDIDVEQDKTVNDLPLTPRPRSRSLGSLGTFEIPDMALMKRALSLPAGLGDDEVMMSDPDLSKINARMSETFEQFCAATLAEALFDHVTMDGNELTFQAGDMIEITDMTDAYWWWGCIDKQEGWLPAPFVRLKVSQGETVEECMSRLQVNTSSNQQGLKPSHEPLIRKVSLSFLSNDQVRANVIKEIITTERDYVKNLADIYEGYIEQARSRPDMFNQTLMSKLFCNIEEIYCFQQRFLTDLEQCIDNDLPHKSAIGDCFLKYKLTFDIYGEYCNNYPHAVNEFQELMKDNKYVQFFEACRLLQSMIKIQLDGFLLTPVQKICKYPLQLNELLKYTRPQHPDFQPLKSALEAMREVAQSINERKRRIEHIENIALWQKTIGDWEGDDVLDRSSMLIYSDEVNRVSLTGRHRTSPRQLFLFDHQLIICRKLWVDEWIDKTRKGEISGKEYLTASVYMWRDILRRDLYVYKDRIDLDDCQIEDLPDGKENEWNVTLRYAWKIQNFEDQSKVYVFMCRSRKEKRRWLRHFAKERKIVHEGLTRVSQGSLRKNRPKRRFKSSSFMAAKEAALKTSTTNKPSKPTDRVMVRRALSMPHRKARDPNGKEPPLQLPRMASTEVEPDVSTPKKKGISLFGVQFGKK